MPTFVGAIQNNCVKNPSGTSINVVSRCQPCCLNKLPCRSRVTFGSDLPYAYGFVSFGYTLSASPTSDSDFLIAGYYAGSATVSTYAAPAYGACPAGTMYYVSGLPTTLTSVNANNPYVTYPSVTGLSRACDIDVYGLYESGLVGSTFSLYAHVFSRSVTNLSEINAAIASVPASCLTCANSFFCLGGGSSVWQNIYGEGTSCRTTNTPASSTTAGVAIKALSGQSISYSPATFPELNIVTAASIPKYCRWDIDLNNAAVVTGQTYYT